MTLLTWRFLTARRQWCLSGTAFASMRAVTRPYTPPETVATLTAEDDARQDSTKTANDVPDAILIPGKLQILVTLSRWVSQSIISGRVLR